MASIILMHPDPTIHIPINSTIHTSIHLSSLQVAPMVAITFSVYEAVLHYLAEH